MRVKQFITTFAVLIFKEMGSKLLTRTLKIYRIRKMKAKRRKVHPKPDNHGKNLQQINKPVIDRLEAFLKNQ